MFPPDHPPAGTHVNLVPTSIIKQQFYKCRVVPKGTNLIAGLLIFLTLYLEIALELHMNYKYSREFQYTLHPASPNVVISHNHSTIIKTKN